MTAEPVRSMSLHGRVALVTGGTSGIGLAIAKRFACEGAAVAIVGSSDLDRAARIATEVHPSGTCAGFVADVADLGQVRLLIDEVTGTLGAPDIVVSSAGVWYPTPIGELDDRVERMIDVNLMGVINVTGAVAPTMIDRGRGHIVNVASAAGILASPGYSTYSATKAAVIEFTKAAALELAPHGVAINAIAPGNTTTPMNEHVRTDPRFVAEHRNLELTTPSRRPFTPPHEVAELALVLVDGRIQAFHGSVISIDEGRTAGRATGGASAHR